MESDGESPVAADASSALPKLDWRSERANCEGGAMAEAESFRLRQRGLYRLGDNCIFGVVKTHTANAGLRLLLKLKEDTVTRSPPRTLTLTAIRRPRQLAIGEWPHPALSPSQQ